MKKTKVNKWIWQTVKDLPLGTAKTVVINGDTGEVLHLAEGKKKESLVSFFEKLSAKQFASIEVGGID